MAIAASPATPPESPPSVEPVEARRLALRRQAAAIRTRLRLPPRLTLSEWADRYRVIPPPAAQPGPWRTDRAPYLREIMDTISRPGVETVTIVKCAQSGGTEVLNNAVGFYIDQEPSSILVIQPNVKPMAEDWSKTRLSPMLAASPRLRGKVKDPRARDSGNTIQQKLFADGFLSIAGANSPAGLASRPIRVVLADELDRWAASAGTEGDPLALAEARQTTFGRRRKLLTVSTPGNEGESRIEREWADSDQRHFYVPCPHCGHEQPLEWRDTGGQADIRPGRGAYRLVWEKAVGADGETIHRPETARYQCRSCEHLIDETAKPAMLAAGRWIAHRPRAARVGFHIPGLLSPWRRWSALAEEWLRVRHEPEARKTFFNTRLGLLYVEAGETQDPAEIAKRREAWGDGIEVPAFAGALTAAIDVQADRLEVQVVAWGAGEESAVVRLERLYGDPDGFEVWERADAILTRPFRHASGAPMRVRACMVDSGYAADAVYRFVRPRQARGVFAAKGVEGAKAPLSRASKANRDGVKLFSFHPGTFKGLLMARLKRVSPGPGYVHVGTEAATGVDAEWFAQLGAEKRVVEWRTGRPQVTWRKIRDRNEAIDLCVLNVVALRALGQTFARSLEGLVAQVTARGARAEAESVADPAPEPPAPSASSSAPDARPRRGRPRRGWVHRY